MSRYQIRPTGVGILPGGAGYSVRDLGADMMGYTNMLDKELGVSLDAGLGHTRWVQLHELSHVHHDAHTPGQVQDAIAKRYGKRVALDSVLSAMDVRVNELVTRAVPDAHDGFRAPATPTWRQDEYGYAASHASPPGTKEGTGATLDADVRAAIDKKLAEVSALPTERVTVAGVVMPLALWLDELVNRQRRGQPQDGSRPDEGAGEGQSFDKDEAELSKDEKALGEPKPGKRSPCGGGFPAPEVTGSTWLIPEVIEPELTVVRAPGNACVTTAESGTRIRWQQGHRIVTDGVIFRRNKRRPGTLQRGTVLIDNSGSMNFTVEDLAELVALLPHATVATYSGDAHAELHVVAREGRSVAAMPRGLGGNTCDGPALLWLSRMPAPRLWISDGNVNGRMGSSVPLVEECAAIMEAASVVQLVKAKSGADIATARLERQHPGRIDTASLPGLLRQIERGTVER